MMNRRTLFSIKWTLPRAEVLTGVAILDRFARYARESAEDDSISLYTTSIKPCEISIRIVKSYNANSSAAEKAHYYATIQA